jgi:hypothetical protein
MPMQAIKGQMIGPNRAKGSVRLIVQTPDDAEVAALYPDEVDATAIGPIPAGIQVRLDELGRAIDRDTTITLSRNWEGCAFGIVDGDADPRFEVLAFTEEGRVGHGGINQPAYHDSIAELFAADEAEAP